MLFEPAEPLNPLVHSQVEFIALKPKLKCLLCQRQGALELFYSPPNNSHGVHCTACGRKHALGKQRMWLPKV